jgi:hypothetical protein
MTAEREIRADFDETSIVVYQAYSPAIAEAALAAQRFVPPFLMNRMTWIKPSFLWMMERSGWAQKPDQERVLAIRISRAGWEEALSLAVLTDPDRRVYASPEAWREQIAAAPVRVQWDPERNLRGAALDNRSIQVGLSRDIVARYVEEWTQSIEDYTPLVRKLSALIREGSESQARPLLPRERVYPLSDELARRLGIGLAAAPQVRRRSKQPKPAARGGA